MKKFFSLTVALLSVGVLLMSSSAAAVEYGGVGGQPAHPRADNPRTKSIFIHELKAGESAQDGVRIYNNTPTKRTISVYPVDAVLASGGTFSCAQKVEPRKDVGSWIKLESDSVTLEANGTVEIPFTITAPAKADVGEHNGCIAMEDASMKTKQDAQSGVVLGFRSAIRVAVTIPGKIVKSLSLESVEVTRLDNGNFGIAPTAKNTGNVSLDTTLTTSLTPLFGTGHTDKNGSFPVLARSTASWNFESERPFWGGWYRATVTASYDDSPDTTLGDQGGHKTTISKTSAMFFAPPKPLAFVIEAVILGLVAAAVIWLFSRRSHKRRVKHHWKLYKVKPGDTVQHIAEKHHISWKRLARANKLKPPYTIREGQSLKVPPTIEE